MGRCIFYKKMISIITGTLNRINFLDGLINNTVDSNEKLELVLVDGGSNDGTIEYIKNLNHNRIKLIEVGKRSPYPHYMNLGIKNSSHNYVCQWNDDVLLINDWSDIISQIEDCYDFYLFNWKNGNREDYNNDKWKKYNDRHNGWCLLNSMDNNGNGEIVMNYGIYKKEIFKAIGMYSNEYKYYCADGDMSARAFMFGYKVKEMRDIKVLSIETEKRALHFGDDFTIYKNNLNLYKNKKINKEFIEYL